FARLPVLHRNIQVFTYIPNYWDGVFHPGPELVAVDFYFNAVVGVELLDQMHPCEVDLFTGYSYLRFD
ncbi:MAG: hypothetical protein LBT25_05260, partial [Candidatus Symbiothrix sp.]|nr:hypothetical protein [Candidatus Symbiothrix sp.]